MPGITSSHYNFDVGFTIRATGTTTNTAILSSGFLTFIGNASSDFSAVGFTTLNNTTFDTTSTNTLDITAQFNSTNSANFIYSEFFVLNKIY